MAHGGMLYLLAYLKMKMRLKLKKSTITSYVTEMSHVLISKTMSTVYNATSTIHLYTMNRKFRLNVFVQCNRIWGGTAVEISWKCTSTKGHLLKTSLQKKCIELMWTYVFHMCWKFVPRVPWLWVGWMDGCECKVITCAFLHIMPWIYATWCEQ